jgi:hypothetical protein
MPVWALRMSPSVLRRFGCGTVSTSPNGGVAFQAIADANPGPDGMPSGNSGEPSYQASADYVAGVMRQAGYDVTIQTYKFYYFAFVGLPRSARSRRPRIPSRSCSPAPDLELTSSDRCDSYPSHEQVGQPEAH